MEKSEKVKLSDFLKTVLKVIKISIETDKRRVIIIFTTTVLMATLGAISAWILSQFINTAIYSTEQTFLTTKVLIILGSLLLIWTLQSIVSMWNFRVVSYFNRLFFGESYLKVAEASNRIDIQTYESSGFELLRVRVNMYFGKFQNYTDYLQQLISGLIPMIISTSILISLKLWWILPFAIIPALLNFYVEILDGKMMWDAENSVGEERKIWSSHYGFFNSKSYIEEIKIHGLANIFINRLKNIREKINKVFGDRDIVYAKKKLIISIVTDIVEIAVPIILIHQIFTKTLLVGTFFFVNGRFDSFTNNLRQTLRMFTRMYKDAPYVFDIIKFIEFQQVIPNGNREMKSFDKLEVKNVSFTYPGSERIILKDLNFSIAKGEKVAVIGLNGAGKTTLTKLLLRFYLPTSGDIEYNNIKTNDLEKVSFYENIGFLPQDFAKFDLTFRETIALGNIEKEIDDNKVIESAKKSGIHDFIMSHENEYKTQIGKKYKNGVEMSGGQWQKVALSRLFYRNAPLWILDEPTSAIDAEAESLIFEQLEKLPDDITVIMISHRFSTVRNADRIIVIGDGTIVENGTHEQLLKLKGEYSRLFKLQAEGYK